MKRAASPNGAAVSPPPTKRKIESTTTSKAVTSFFTPASNKAPEKLVWKIVHESLVVGHCNRPIEALSSLARPVKIAAFDLDDTLVKPKPKGAKFARNANSHVWWDAMVPGKLKQLHSDGFLVVILTNQGAISLKDNAKALQKDSLSLRNFKDQLMVFMRQLDFPVSVYAATGNDRYRKPRTGMWDEVLEDYDLEGSAVDMENSIYVGDAAGRENTDVRQKDHATSDRDLAANVGIKFQTPEEFFLDRDTEPYTRPFEPGHFLKPSIDTNSPRPPFTKKHAQELVIFCGSPGAGKSSFYWKVMQPQGYERVNQDLLKTREKCIKVAKQFLEEGKSVTVDNTNRDKEARAHWMKVAQEFGIPIRCILFTASARLCEHNDAVRAHNPQANPEKRAILPPIAFRSFAQNYVAPSLLEGFEDIYTIDFKFEGDDAEKVKWSKYWVSKFST